MIKFSDSSSDVLITPSETSSSAAFQVYQVLNGQKKRLDIQQEQRGMEEVNFVEADASADIVVDSTCPVQEGVGYKYYSYVNKYGAVSGILYKTAESDVVTIAKSKISDVGEIPVKLVRYPYVEMKENTLTPTQVGVTMTSSWQRDSFEKYESSTDISGVPSLFHDFIFGDSTVFGFSIKPSEFGIADAIQVFDKDGEAVVEFLFKGDKGYGEVDDSAAVSPTGDISTLSYDPISVEKIVDVVDFDFEDVEELEDEE